MICGSSTEPWIGSAEQISRIGCEVGELAIASRWEGGWDGPLVSDFLPLRDQQVGEEVCDCVILARMQMLWIYCID